MAIHYINFADKDEFLAGGKFIYKFMPLENALRSLKERYLWLANPESWKDPFERRFIDAKYANGKGKLRSFAWKNKILCTCLTETASCEAYWKIYSAKDIAIEFVIDREYLANCLEMFANANSNLDIYIVKVEYMRTDDIRKDLTSIPFKNPLPHKNVNTDDFRAKLLSLKRLAYSYENEVRIILVSKTKLPLDRKDGMMLQFPYFSQMVKTIKLDPENGTETELLLKSYFTSIIEKEILPTSIPKCKVEQSQLYRNKSANIINI